MEKLCGISGGKGNLGLFIERDKKVCAAGLPTAHPTKTVPKCLEHYLMQEEVDALICDAIFPPSKPRELPPLRHQPIRDMRNAGPFSEAASLINPLPKTKFQTLVEDLKESSYASYWKKAVGTVSDPVPTLPPGFNMLTTTLGKKNLPSEQLYDVVMPKYPFPDKTPKSKQPGYQLNHNYCQPSYNPNAIFGMKANVDPRGKFVKSCLTYDDIRQGNALKKPINTILSNIQDLNSSRLAIATAPNNNISCVPKEYAFGKLQAPSNVVECLTTCELNPDKELYLKCLAHLNTLRKFLAKRFESTFFKRLYLSLRYCDDKKTGWLPKELVYKNCKDKLIIINPSLIEPLLSMWNAFDGSQIEYKLLINIINFSLVIPELPKVWDIPDNCIDFRTTYKEMVKPDQKVDKRGRAGLPSGRYFDKDYPVTPGGCCAADRVYLPQESDAKACLVPSVLTLMGVSHRDMYAKRDPETVRQVFEGTGEKFEDERFNVVWDNAKKYHSQGWVCFETFRHSMNELNSKGTFNFR